MASLAVVKVGFAKGALAVMTGHAGLRARVWKVLRGEGRSDLAALRQPARADVVAAIAVKTLARTVVGVTKPYAERAGVGRRPGVAPCRVTRAAG